MIDPKLIRENPEFVKENLAKRQNDEYLQMVDEYIEKDRIWREATKEVESLRRERNSFSKKIPKLQGDERKKAVQQMKALKQKLEEKEKELNEAEERRNWLLDRIPNLLHDSVPFGESDEDNVPIREWGKKPEFSFDPKDHHVLMEINDLADVDRARKVSGARFYYLKNEATMLELALIQFTLNILKEEGFTLFTPPTLVRERALYGTGFLPTGKEDIYKIEGEDLNLIGTSEVALGAYHMDETLLEEDLPLNYCGISNCYRTEASATTKDDKGIFRVHEFKKVEMFKFAHPNKSWDEQEQMVRIAERVFQELGIHYRVVNICTGDIGAVAARKYDIEAWMPGQGRYREVVSCSNCTDYQARRLNVKFREKEGAPPKGFVHTLNSTAIATTRAIVAILENYQQEDGSVIIPEKLRKYTGFDKIIPKIG